jgi:hypothetical protein
MNASDGRIELIGERGFTLSSAVSAIGGRFGPHEQCLVPECDPGTTVSLYAAWLGNDLSGQLTFDGETYNDLGGLSSLTQASVEFIGSFVAPALEPSTTLTTPFRFQGQFWVPDAAGIAQVRHTLSGAGTATVTLSRGFPGDPSWVVNSVRYDFSPVPEPGTMLMVGLGIAGIARRIQRTRAKGQ